MRDVLNDHSRFEELCALEMVDQLSQQQRLELLTHCSSCPACEAWLSDAHVVSSQLLISHQFSVKSEALPIGTDTRFVVEAHRRGISLLYSQGPVYLSRMKLAAAAVMLVAVGMAMGFSIHHATHSVTQEAAVRSEARPEDLVESPTLSPSSAVPNPLNRAPLSRRVISRRAKREARPTHVVQKSPLAAWSQQPNSFQMRSVLFDFSDCCHSFLKSRVWCNLQTNRRLAPSRDSEVSGPWLHHLNGLSGTRLLCFPSVQASADSATQCRFPVAAVSTLLPKPRTQPLI